ncbi:MAG: AAA family ATPase [Gammaproteobacteria bacterium]
MRIISITGGKGGIGKTTISVNLAIAFAKMKKKVLLFDADLGLANVDVLLGLHPKRNINDFLTGDCDLNEICIEGPQGVKIIPAASGMQKMADLSSLESIELIKSFSSLTQEIDVMLVDTASGISNQVINFAHASQEILIVICNDPASLMDSYAVIKILHQKYHRVKFGVIVNRVKDDNEGLSVFSRFQQATEKFLNINLNYMGSLPQDDYIKIAATQRVAVVDKYPTSISAMAFNALCYGITHWGDDIVLSGGIHFFFERLIKLRQSDKESFCIA